MSYLSRKHSIHAYAPYVTAVIVCAPLPKFLDPPLLWWVPRRCVGELLEKMIKEIDEEMVRLTKSLQRYKEKMKYLEEDVCSKNKQLERLS